MLSSILPSFFKRQPPSVLPTMSTVPTADKPEYVELENKHSQLDAAFRKLSTEHLDLLRSVAAVKTPRPTMTHAAGYTYLCRRREVIAVTAEGVQTYGQWGQWYRISKEQYMSESTSHLFAGTSQFKQQPH